MTSTATRERGGTHNHAASANGSNIAVARAEWRDPRYQAFAVMRLAFTVAPIAFGLDKFFNVMVQWPNYLAPWINDIAPGTAQQFMYFVGATEIVAGVIVALKPRYGAYVVAAWLAGIILNLLTYSGFYDIALRDLGLMLGALTLARLASVYDAPVRLGRR
jgi:DoxX